MNVNSRVNNDQLRDWFTTLARVTENNFEGHSYICAGGTSGTNSDFVEIDSHTYHAYRDSCSAYKDIFIDLFYCCFSSCRSSHTISSGKWSIKDLVNHANTLVTHALSRNESDLLPLIRRCAMLQNFEDKEGSLFQFKIQKLEKAFGQIWHLSSIAEFLTLMANRAREKRAAEAVTSIWGKIKWYIWSYFFDPSREIEALRNRLPTKAAALEAGQTSLQRRIKLSMEAFMEEMQISQSDRLPIIEATDDSIPAVFSNCRNILEVRVGQTMNNTALAFKQKVLNCLELWERLDRLRTSELR